MNLGRSGKGFGKLGAAVKVGTGGGAPPSTAGESIGLLLALTKAS